MQTISANDSFSSLSEAALVRCFAAEASSEAFAALVGRYHGLVYGTARRIRAEAVGAWLHRTARNAAMNVNRGEARRRRLEQTMSDHCNAMSATDATPLPDHWVGALDHLDAALDHLNEIERQCVLERYHQGKPLRDIATLIGKSEDAARMTINRTLEKMNRFLRRRGATLSLTGLAAGLATEFSSAAAASNGPAVASVASAALKAAGSSGAGSGLTLFTTAIMTKTTATIGAAALVFLLALGGGWLANRPPSSSAANRPAAAIAKDGFDAATQAAARPTPRRPAAVPATGAIDDVLARLETLRLKRIEINGRIPRNTEGPPDPKVVDDVLKAMEVLERETQAVLAELEATSLPRALAAALKLAGLARDNLVSQLFGRWGALDPEQAMLEVKSLPFSLQNTGRSAIARGWGRRNPMSAIAAVEKLNANDAAARTSFLREVFTGWLQVDAAAAVRALPDLPVDDQRPVARAFSALGKSPAQRAAATAEIAKLTDDTVRAEVAHQVTEDWARLDGPAAAAWLDALPWQNPRAALEAAGELMKEWGKGRGQMAPALDWFWPKVPDDWRPDILEDFVAGRWAKVDRAAAEAWLAKHGIATSEVPDWDRRTR